MTFRVQTGIGGSHCVVWKTPEHYLEARKDARQPHLTFIEIVRNGQVYLRDIVENICAPERILLLAKENMQ